MYYRHSIRSKQGNSMASVHSKHVPPHTTAHLTEYVDFICKAVSQFSAVIVTSVN